MLFCREFRHISLISRCLFGGDVVDLHIIQIPAVKAVIPFNSIVFCSLREDNRSVLIESSGIIYRCAININEVNDVLGCLIRSKLRFEFLVVGINLAEIGNLSVAHIPAVEGAAGLFRSCGRSSDIVVPVIIGLHDIVGAVFIEELNGIFLITLVILRNKVGGSRDGLRTLYRRRSLEPTNLRIIVGVGISVRGSIGNLGKRHACTVIDSLFCLDDVAVLILIGDFVSGSCRCEIIRENHAGVCNMSAIFYSCRNKRFINKCCFRRISAAQFILTNHSDCT